ncbi:hypothetical protein PCH_Pc14g02200 [Penicillium rubens Wisconsin 54-1255]|uniref:Uncharacterized protein n=1 Tax=Penicillium rubens (strain ATCC 28089 / DSM 1075 / NRRL 1951 / Wisconsin 54-1255) TaxID=500485 RepID=B6H647_PENRW|nr:hypothetical protein PCH_Pc14g02200 [Penicillium rubens Wisconsin 54-1255]
MAAGRATSSLKQLVRRRMHVDAVCAGIGRPVACEKGYHFTSLLPKSAALVAVGCGDHALANRLYSDARVIDNYQEQLWCSQELESKDSRLNIVVKNLMLPHDC